jgi:hypothetical protein
MNTTASLEQNHRAPKFGTSAAASTVRKFTELAIYFCATIKEYLAGQPDIRFTPKRTSKPPFDS